MNVKNVIFVSFIILTGITACKKSKNDPNPSAQSIVLDTLQVSGNVVTLKWSKLENDSLTAYQVLRTDDSTNISSTVTVSADKNTVQFTDTLLLAPYVQYHIVATGPKRTITSNEQVYARKDINFIPIGGDIDAVYDKTTHTAYIYNITGDIVAYDVTNKKVSQTIHRNSSTYQVTLASYNGKEELYVCDNESVIIYDATTLVQVGAITTNVFTSNIVANNGILYLNCTDTLGSITTFDRATGKMISKHTDSSMNMKLIPNTTSEFYAANNGSQVLHYRFDSKGNFISSKIDSTPGIRFTSVLLAVYPDGSRFIVSGNGVVQDSSLANVTTLPHGSLSFNSFDFDETNKLIYAAANNRLIVAYGMNNYTLAQTINTLGYPYKVFYDNGQVVAVTGIFPDHGAGHLAIELF